MDEYQTISGIEDKANKFYAINNPLTYHYEYDMENIERKKKEVLYVGRISEYPKEFRMFSKFGKL